MEKKVYVVIRPDGLVVVTDRLRDARRALKAKYRGCLKWYGNVHWIYFYLLFPGKADSLAGVYTLGKLWNALRARLGSGKEQEIAYFVEAMAVSAEMIVKHKHTAVKIAHMAWPDASRLLPMVISKARGWRALSDGELSAMFIEFPRRYAALIHNGWLAVYVSVRKNATADVIAKSASEAARVLQRDANCMVNVAREFIAKAIAMADTCNEKVCKDVASALHQVHAAMSLLLG